MGQRHQIYVRTGNRKGFKTNLFGFHHQWLWGFTAIRLLSNVVRFAKEADAYVSPFIVDYRYDDAKEIIKSCFSCDPENGYFHDVHELVDGETKNPLCGDNNNGITIIDFKGSTEKETQLKYCFMALDNRLECLAKGQNKNYIPLNPIDARTYLNLHYPTLLSNQTYMHSNSGKQKEELRRWDDNHFAQIKNDLAVIEGFAKVLTLTEVKNLFPVMYAKKKRA